MGGVVLPSGGPGSDAGNPAYRAVPQAHGSSAVLPLPGAGPAAAAAAILVAVPMAAGQPVDHAAVAALALAWPMVLTLVGVALSTALFAVVSGARSPRAAKPQVAATPPPVAAKPQAFNVDGSKYVDLVSDEDLRVRAKLRNICRGC